MLPINETIKIEGVKYKVKSIDADRYRITHQSIEFVLTKGEKWEAPPDVSKILAFKLGKEIDELIWFRGMGI